MSMVSVRSDQDGNTCQPMMWPDRASTVPGAKACGPAHQADEPLSTDAARALRGSGWDGDLEELRADL